MPQEVRVPHETYSTICGTPVLVRSILDSRNLTALAGRGPRMHLQHNRKGVNLASQPSRGPQIGQGPLKWTQINQGQVGCPFWGSLTHLVASGSQQFCIGFIARAARHILNVYTFISYLQLGRIRRWMHCFCSTKFGSSRKQRPWLRPIKADTVEFY